MADIAQLQYSAATVVDGYSIAEQSHGAMVADAFLDATYLQIEERVFLLVQ